MDVSVEDSHCRKSNYSNNLSDVPSDEEFIIRTLVQRYEQGQIYTWVGPLLLAINKCPLTTHLHDPLRHEKFVNICNVSQEEIEPHVFAIAARAQYRLTHGLAKVHQVIIISGDSGSGKTFTACEALNFLAFMNKNSPSYCSNTVSSTLRRIESACSLISAFSTATTERNKYSSRHGQLLQLQYKGGNIDGAVIHSFLLERSRVTSEKNNFHIFYQLLSGLSESKLHALKLSRTSKYNIIRDACDWTNEHHSKGYNETVAAMQALDFEDETRDNILKVLALLIHLGNVKFKKSSTGLCLVDVDEADSRNSLQDACELASLPADNLTELLTTTLISPQSQWRRHTIYHRSLDSIETCNNRLRCIIKYLYNRLFHWLVHSLNETLAAKGKNYSLLGILDIFGFESFTENGIEQLCINYASERLQLYFNQEFLEAGRKELEEEGLDILPLQKTTQIYQQRLSVIEGSLFAVLNDACFIPGVQSNSSLKRQLLCIQETTKTFLHIGENSFIIRHYSCPVEYSTSDMLPKNTDKVPGELSSTLSRCGNKFILSLIDTVENETSFVGRVYAKKNTTLAKLKQSLDALMKELDKCDSHYIRCVKPISNKNCGAREEFREQLACSGVFDALPLVKCGFPVRLRYGEFHKRYSKNPTETCDTVQQCRVILETLVISEELKLSVHFGSGLIFLTEAILRKLELFRDEYHSECATKIQRFWIKHKPRKTEKQQREEHSEKNGIEQQQAIPVIPKSLSQDDNDVFTTQVVNHSTPCPIEMDNGKTKHENQSSFIQEQNSKIHNAFGNDNQKLHPDIEHINIVHDMTRVKQKKEMNENNGLKFDASGMCSSNTSSSGNDKRFIVHVKDIQDPINESSQIKTYIMEEKILDSHSSTTVYNNIGISLDLCLGSDDNTICDYRVEDPIQSMEKEKWGNGYFRSKTTNVDEEIETCIDVTIGRAQFDLSDKNQSQSNIFRKFEESSATCRDCRTQSKNYDSSNNILPLHYENLQQFVFDPVGQHAEPILEQKMNRDVSFMNIRKQTLKQTEIFDRMQCNQILRNNSSPPCAFFKSSSDPQDTLISRMISSNISPTTMSIQRDEPKCIAKINLRHSDYIQQYSQNVQQHDSVDKSDCSPIVKIPIYDEKIAVINHNNDRTFKRYERDGVQVCHDEFNDMHWKCSKSRLSKPSEKAWKCLFSHARLPFLINNDSELNDGNNHTVYLENRIFFYKSGILSKRRLSEVPIRFHTRLTCLPGSHQLPRSELPRGLQDCL